MLPLLLLGMQAASQIQQGQAAKQTAKYNAALGERNAEIERQVTAAELVKHNRLTRKTQGAARAAIGASGVTIEGSPLDVLEESAANAEFDRLMIKYKGDVKASGYEAGAALDNYRGKQAAQAGFSKAAGTLLGHDYGGGGGTKIPFYGVGNSPY